VSDTAFRPEADPAIQWWVQVRGQAFGPYTQSQLVEFIREGRIRPSTPVSQRADGGWVEARRVYAFTTETPQQPAANAHADVEVSNVFVHAEINSAAWGAFLAALEAMGGMCELASGLWILRTRLSAGVIRNTLSQTLERGDRFVVIDASRDRLAWFNLGPEMDARIREVWNAPLKDAKRR